MSLRLVLISGILLFGSSLPVSATLAEAQPQDFNAETFARAQAEGRVILVESYAGWCLTCRIQSPSLQQVLRNPRYAFTLVFRLREHSPKAAWKQLGLKSYGAMIIYRGHTETARQIGPRTQAEIEALLETAHDPAQARP